MKATDSSYLRNEKNIIEYQNEPDYVSTSTVDPDRMDICKYKYFIKEHFQNQTSYFLHTSQIWNFLNYLSSALVWRLGFTFWSIL